MSEEEKRLHRCCFTGHRPEKISATDEEVKAWLEEQIDQAIADGYTTFISGCAIYKCRLYMLAPMSNTDFLNLLARDTVPITLANKTRQI